MTFLKGQGGRMKGSRNRLNLAFVDALREEFEAHGADAIKICRLERPIEFLKIVASVLPKEIEFSSETKLAELSDADLDAFLEFARRKLAERSGGAAIREVTEADREQVALLPPVRETS
jgi:hypothetical protein